MRKRTILSVVLVLGLLLFSGVPAASAVEPGRFRMGHEATEGHPYDFGARYFAEQVHRLSDGAMTVDVFPAGQLGTQAQMLESISMGTLDFALTNSFSYEPYAPEWGVLTVPLLFENYHHLLAVVRGEIGQAFKDMVLPRGIKVLEFLRMGETTWHSTTPFPHPDDIVGRRIRIMAGRSHTILGEVLEMIVTPTSFGEVYSALQLGAMEGNLQPIINVYGMRFFEVAPYYANFHLAHFTQPFAMSLDVWNRITPAQREVVLEAARLTRYAQYDFAIEFERRALEYMVNYGGLILYDGDEEAWRVALQPMFERLSEWEHWFEAIRNYPWSYPY